MCCSRLRYHQIVTPEFGGHDGASRVLFRRWRSTPACPGSVGDNSTCRKKLAVNAGGGRLPACSVNNAPLTGESRSSRPAGLTTGGYAQIARARPTTALKERRRVAAHGSRAHPLGPNHAWASCSSPDRQFCILKLCSNCSFDFDRSCCVVHRTGCSVGS